MPTIRKGEESLRNNGMKKRNFSWNSRKRCSHPPKAVRPGKTEQKGKKSIAFEKKKRKCGGAKGEKIKGDRSPHRSKCFHAVAFENILCWNDWKRSKENRVLQGELSGLYRDSEEIPERGTEEWDKRRRGVRVQVRPTL